MRHIHCMNGMVVYESELVCVRVYDMYVRVSPSTADTLCSNINFNIQRAFEWIFILFFHSSMQPDTDA